VEDVGINNAYMDLGLTDKHKTKIKTTLTSQMQILKYLLITMIILKDEIGPIF